MPSDPRSAEAEPTLVVATYNIHRCVGAKRVADPVRIARVLGELDADVIALQEVGSTERSVGAGAVLDALERATSLRSVAGVTLRDADGDYGNALLTRLPVTKLTRHDLTAARGREPRGAIEAVVETRAGRARLLATHLGLDRRERRDQVDRLLGLIGDPPEPGTILLGDMNEWRPVASGLRRLDRLFGPVRRPSSFPARRPLLALDRIWAAQPWAVRTLSVHRSPLARVASDHLPVVARLGRAK